MKPCDVKSLRGVFTGEYGTYEAGKGYDELLFEYLGSDLTRGWKVIHADFWLLDPATGIADQTVTLRVKLQTDVILGTTPTAYDMPVTGFNPNDNREFAWYTRNYENMGCKILADNFVQCIIDPDHVITKQLYASSVSYECTEGEGSRYDIGYCIVVQEIKTTPSQNILQTVKGIGQNITN